MDALDSVFEPLREFSKDSYRLVKRCHKPDRKAHLHPYQQYHCWICLGHTVVKECVEDDSCMFKKRSMMYCRELFWFSVLTE
ncbi:hypothetical protein L1987_36492 [Smallanthus sonchifolius]|uniref:Uncharacterized protein n=1 Tax=Smallanthus sonchifolius TaxID=185202 RepID=A0ACB9HDC1_9ASTR|nr:hypothetical protein L1987_36492 [Smallanthus sonchifolius]